MKKLFNNNILKNKKGQMAIFIAIIFQVLFVLFAMSINVALVVHDKVNLQNSVDLAAYYGAQKQAELLNVIAHQNYQVRQAWKLLAWRYRVLGQYGIGANRQNEAIYHPARPRAQDPNSNDEIFKPNLSAKDEVLKETPIICIGFDPTWKPTTGPDQFCYKRTFSVPSVSRSNVIALVSASAQVALNQGIDYQQQNLVRTCQNLVAFNYGYATSIMASFRLEQKARREIIYGLINQMQKSSGDFNDLNGDSVSEGVNKMVRKNLTLSNLENGPPEVDYYNSLGNRSVNFFSSIDVNPRVYYTDSRNTNCTISDSSSKNVSQYPSGRAKDRFLELYDSGEKLYEWAQESVRKNSILQYSLGIEKNPWSWVYSAVVAQTTTRPIFFPIGERLTIKARAFAKPFGGRIGPWHKDSWARGDRMSRVGSRVDKLVPPRLDENGSEASNQELRKDTTIFPNHSRYPGDEQGLRSNLALNSLKNFKDIVVSSFSHYQTLTTMGNNNHDSLVPDGGGVNIRNHEIAAIAPDLFDSTYYSIEPEFSKVYLNKLRAKKAELFEGGGYVDDVSNIKILGDLGSTPEKALDVYEQIRISKQLKNGSTFYFLNEAKHLLTGWLHGIRALDFSDENVKPWFANCKTSSYGDEDAEFKIPGGCLENGGRTGYSVKLFSGQIFKTDLELGGRSGGTGKVLNPPDERIWR